MYNAFSAKKKASQQLSIRKHSENVQKYVNRYYNKTRPSLIDNYNKRINSFIRKMQQNPIVVSLDPNTKESARSDDEEEQGAENKNKFIGEHTFKFKDNQDWKSMYTPWERIQRNRNYQLFKLKYGDPSIAFRSIGSQSEYNPSLSNQFRIRDKSKQINPPMKYTNKPTKQVLAELKKNKGNKKQSQGNKSNTRRKLVSADKDGNKEQQILFRRNTGSSLSGFNQQISNYDNNSVARETDFHYSHQGEDHQASQKQLLKSKKNEKKQMETKLHFKEIIDLEQNINDAKTKKALRNLLYKCGVYRRKNKRAVTDSDVDKLSQLEVISIKH